MRDSVPVAVPRLRSVPSEDDAHHRGLAEAASAVVVAHSLLHSSIVPMVKVVCSPCERKVCQTATFRSITLTYLA